MKTDRLLAILIVLLGKTEVTARELAQRFEVSQRTIYRDIQSLENAGLPLVATQGAGGGIRLMEGYTLARGLLSLNEQQDILLALATMAAARQPGAEQALTKLRAVLKAEPPLDWLRVDFAPWGFGKQEEDKFFLLRAAVLEQRLVSFSYVNSQGQHSLRTVEPMILLVKGMGWYLIGWCRMRRAFRMFRLSRMRDARLLEDRFLRRQWEESPPRTEPVHAEMALCFAPCVEHRLRDEYPDEMIHRLPDGRMMVRPRYPVDNWVYGHLMSFGANVEVLEPEWLRERIAGMHAEAAAQYADRYRAGENGQCAR